MEARPVKALTAQKGMKFCGKCQKELPRNRDFFDQDKEKEDGFKNWCKTCRKERRDLAKAKEAAELMKTLDLSVLANLADAKPGGTTIPHVAEIYQNVMALMGGVQGYSMHLVANFIAAPPGGQIRQRIIADIGKMGMAVSDSNKVSMPTELMEDEELKASIARDELRIREEERAIVLQGECTEATDDGLDEQPDAGCEPAA